MIVMDAIAAEKKVKFDTNSACVWMPEGISHTRRPSVSFVTALAIKMERQGSLCNFNFGLQCTKT